jgi:ABC-type nitrate/sulfonate/bicarbonate transport system permease component
MRFMWGQGLKGLLVGVPLGGLAGLGVCMWLIDGTLLFPGDTMLFGAILCGVLGFLYGETFFQWLKDNWYHVAG